MVGKNLHSFGDQTCQKSSILFEYTGGAQEIDGVFPLYESRRFYEDNKAIMETLY